MFRKALLGALVGVLAATAFALPAAAQDYVVGVTAALTGPPSSTYAPAVDAMRLYIDRVNAAGGVNGRKIRLVIEDDGAQPSKAAANTKKLITQDNVVLMVNASLSSTYAPVIAETKSAEVPLLFASGVCPQSVYPPADPLQFCTTGYASHFDSQATLDFIKATAKGPVKIGFSAMAIPLSRGEMDYAMELSKKVGMEPVDQEVIPPPTADYTPFATKLKDAGPNWVYSWAPWVTQVRTLEALRKLGWNDDYIAWGHLEAEAELVRLKDGKFYVDQFERAVPGRPADPERDRCGRQAGRLEIPGADHDRRLDRRHGDRGRAEGGRRIGRPRQAARRDGKPDHRHQRPARRADRVDQGQPLPHAALLPRLQVGRQQDLARAGLEELRGEVSQQLSFRGAAKLANPESRRSREYRIPGPRLRRVPE